MVIKRLGKPIRETDLQHSNAFAKLNDSNEIRTHNHLVRKQTLNHLAKLA